MTAAEIERIIALILGAYELNSLIPVAAIAAAIWFLLFVYYLTAGTKERLWKSGAFGRRLALVWSWIWTAAAISGGLSWMGFVAWRLSSGVIPLPAAPNEPVAIIFGYGLLVAAILLAIGRLPLVLMPHKNRAANPRTPATPVYQPDETSHQPLYPELSFEPNHQRTTFQPQETVSGVAPPARPKTRKPRRGRKFVAAGVAVLVVGIVGVLGAIVLTSPPSTPATSSPNERFALNDFASNFAGFFSGATNDSDIVIRDEALAFQTVGDEIRDGDFTIDVGQWRPLAEQGNAAAQYKLGVMFANGRGTSRDYIEAHRWLNLSAAQGNARAAEGRDAVAGRMTPDEVETAQNRARETKSFGAATALGELPARLTRMTPQQLVRATQNLLNANGYRVGIADGLAGPRTLAAVRDFERLVGVPVTGQITPGLVLRLERAGQRAPRVASKLGPTAVAIDPAVSQAPLALARETRRAAPGTQCDRLAGHPSNSLEASGIYGVSFARIDAPRAIAACEQAVAQYPDELRFRFQLARSLHRAERHGEALALYSEAGDQGFALAQRSVGFMYINGSGVAQDPAKAAQWLHRAADRCDVDAQFALGTLYAKGQGVEKNEAESLRWFRMAAAQNHPDARGRLTEFTSFSANPADFSLSGRSKFEPVHYTAARHVERLLIAQQRPVIDAFVRQDYAAVLDAVRPLAEQGVAPAQTLLGYMLGAGLGVVRDDATAVEWYRKAAAQEDANAQFLLGYMHQSGLGVPQYFAQALQWYRKSAQQGVAAARVNLGVMYEDAQGVARDRQESLAQFFSAAETGLAGAQHSLGTAYEFGRGIERDLDEAIKWYRRAADQNFALSQNKLGEMYSRGKGVERDRGEAVKWYQLAADQGLPDAQFNLAKSASAGQGVPRDTDEALKWYTRAAEQGHAESQVSVAFAYLKSNGARRNYSDAAVWFQRAAEQCNADAQYQLASMYRLGRGVAEASAAEELKWLKLAAEQGQTNALRSLSERYADGKGVEKDPALALRLTRRAAASGHASAQFDLAEVYATGTDAVLQDYALAAEWYEKAARQGHSKAQRNLAELYRDGLGLPRSYVEAVKWYAQAAAQGDPLAQHGLATAFRFGAGVEQSSAEAVAWYRKAAQQGEVNSQRDLGLHYLRGDGVLQDYVQARLWLGLAMAAGDSEAASTLDRLTKKMTFSQIAKAERLAKERSPDNS